MWASPFSLFGRFPKPAITYQSAEAYITVQSVCEVGTS